MAIVPLNNVHGNVYVFPSRHVYCTLPNKEQQVKQDEAVGKKLYRPRTVAVMADMSVSQIYKLIQNGTLQSIRVGKSVRVTAAAVDQMIADSSRS